MGSVMYRVAKANDCLALARMRYDFRVKLDRATEAQARFVRRCAAWMKKELKQGLWRCWLAERDGRVVGHVWVHLIEKIPNPVGESERHAYVSNCYVVPEMRNQRIGEKLLKQAIAWCRAKGTDAIILWPTTRSRSFYMRCGFEASTRILVRQQKTRGTHHRRAES